MSRRIDIELTSQRPDGSFTWRAAGAKQPKGDIESTMVPPNSSVGDVLKVDIEKSLDGLSVTAVVQSKDNRVAPARLEILGSKSPTNSSPCRSPRRARAVRATEATGATATATVNPAATVITARVDATRAIVHVVAPAPPPATSPIVPRVIADPVPARVDLAPRVVRNAPPANVLRRL